MLLALASPAVSFEGREGLIPFAKYQNLYRHIIDIVMQPGHHAYYEKTCQTDFSTPLDHTLRHIIVNDDALRELEKRSVDVAASERRLYPTKKLDVRRLFGHDKRSAIDDHSAKSPTNGEDESVFGRALSGRPLPPPVKDLSRDVVKLQEDSITGGGFCDVYLGEARFCNKVERVAMKMLRVRAAEQKVKKVSRNCTKDIKIE